MLIDLKPSELLESFLLDYKTLFPEIDLDVARKYIKDGMSLATGNGSCPYFEGLTDSWYKFLSVDDISSAYNLYDDEYYFTDIWCCFVVYSRRYLRNIVKPSFPDDTSIADYLKNIKSFIDLGCGIGYSTSALCEIFPNASGFATNLKTTRQWKLCELQSKKYNFQLIEDVSEVSHSVDLVFASEYFEHIYDCESHLDNIIKYLSPKYLLIANAFNTKALGHFTEYKSKLANIDQREMSKWFNNKLKLSGYRQVKCKVWNNKPTLWERIDD